MADFDPDAFAAKPSKGFDPDAFIAKAAPAATSASAGDETTPTEAIAGHAADNIPFSRQIAAAIGAAQMKAAGSPIDFGENYNQLLLAQQRQLDQSKKEHPALSRLGSGLGFAGTAAAFPGRGLASLAGIGALFGLSDATTNPEASAKDVARQTAASAVLAPVLGRAAEAVAPAAGAGLEALGGRLENLAGWLKVNSIHPTPKLGEAMESIPGGKAAVGLELLQRGIGGVTKAGTAEQVSAARTVAGRAMGDIATAYDAAGGAPIDLNRPLAQALRNAAELQDEPTTRAAGQRLEQLVYDYAQKYQGQPVPATEALALKRALGSAAYKQGAAAGSGDTVAGDFGEGMGRLERAVDSALDESLGPEFERANLSFRRLLKAKAATDRQEARGAANHLIGLIPALAGVGGYASHGGPGALAGTLGAALLNKYGSQAGARVLYSPVAGGLALLGRGLPVVGGRLAAEEAPSLAGLIRMPQNSTPALADRDTQRKQTLAALLGGP